MSLEGVVEIFETGEYSVARATASTWSSTGYPVAGSPSTITIAASVQPESGTVDVKMSAGGKRAEYAYVIYTETVLRIATTTTAADVVTIDGEPCEVVAVETWTLDDFTHCRAYAARARPEGGP